MSSLDLDEIHRQLSEPTIARLDEFESFASIVSTNTYLLGQAAPAPGRFRVAVADEQTSGRGRHSRRWASPPSAGLYLSLAYTFGRMPAQLPALTLALGVGVIAALESFGDGGFRIKWPNDIIARDGKLGGILTEARPSAGTGVSVVTGVGINIELPENLDLAEDSRWALSPVDLAGVLGTAPSRARLAGSIVEGLVGSMVRFESSGLVAFVDGWEKRDWLRGRHVVVELAGETIGGIASGIEPDGALRLDGPGGPTRIASGSIVMVGGTEIQA